MLFKLDTLYMYINPFKLNGISHYYQLDKSIFVFKGFGW